MSAGAPGRTGALLTSLASPSRRPRRGWSVQTLAHPGGTLGTMGSTKRHRGHPESSAVGCTGTDGAARRRVTPRQMRWVREHTGTIVAIDDMHPQAEDAI